MNVFKLKKKHLSCSIKSTYVVKHYYILYYFKIFDGTSDKSRIDRGIGPQGGAGAASWKLGIDSDVPRISLEINLFAHFWFQYEYD